jgi:hypothetical protein
MFMLAIVPNADAAVIHLVEEYAMFLDYNLGIIL